MGRSAASGGPTVNPLPPCLSLTTRSRSGTVQAQTSTSCSFDGSCRSAPDSESDGQRVQNGHFELYACVMADIRFRYGIAVPFPIFLLD